MIEKRRERWTTWLHGRALLTLLALAGTACGDGEGVGASSQPAGRGTASFCESHDALSRRLGCTPLHDECVVPAVCEETAQAWLRCVERDTRQCICERDEQRDLNCEGSYKPDEGPARCIAEYDMFDACMDEHAGFTED